MLKGRALRIESVKKQVEMGIRNLTITGFIDWLNLRDYEDAVKSARMAVIKRYARGNVSFQNGNILDDEALMELRARGDEAFAELDAQEKASVR